MEKQGRNIGSEDEMTPYAIRARELAAEAKEAAKEREEAQKSPFKKDWTQNSKTYYERMDWLAGKSAMAVRVFNFLVIHMDNYNAVMCSYRVLMEKFSVKQITIWKAIRILKEKGYVVVLKSGTSNVYAINHDLVWRSWGNNMKYSKFPVNVIIAESEQSESETRIKATRLKQLELKEGKGQEKQLELKKRTPQRNQQGSQSQSQLMAEFLRPM